MCWRAVILYTLLLLLSNVSAQPFKVAHYSVREGLPSVEVYEVFQDRQKFIWFSTDNGVVRFDGQEMKIFQKKNGLLDPVVFGIQEDDKGRLWFRSFSGKLCYYADGTIHPYKYNDRLPSEESINGFLRFVTTRADGLVCSTWGRITEIDSLGNVRRRSIARGNSIHYFDIEGKLLSGFSGSNAVDSVFFRDMAFPIQLSNVNGHKPTALVHWNGCIFFSQNNDVFKLEGNTLTKAKVFEKNVISLSVDKNNDLWVGLLNGGVLRFTVKDLHQPWTIDFLREKSVTKVLHDHDGGYWFSTLEDGVFYAPNLNIRQIPLSISSLSSGVDDADRDPIFYDRQGTVYTIEASSQKLRTVASFGSAILGLYRSRNNDVWISSGGYIKQFSRALQLRRAYRGGAIDFAEADDGTIWTVGTNRVKKIERDGTLSANYTTIASYRQILITGDRIFLAARTGFDAYDGAFNLISRPKDLDNIKISDIRLLNDTTLLLSTIGDGLVLFNTRTNAMVGKHNSSTGFIADNVFTTIEDDSVLWHGTENGLIKIRKDAFAQDTLPFHHFTEKNGLASNKVDFVALQDGDVWAFTESVISVVPRSFVNQNRLPIFYWKGMSSNNVDHRVARELTFPPHHNNLNFRFGFISFSDQNIFIRYKLNSDEAWKPLESRSILLAALSPGTYELRVSYSVDNHHWTSTEPVVFTIEKPWWKTSAFIGVVTLFLGTIFILYIRYEQRRYRQRSQYLQIINEQQQRLIHSEIATRERERNRISKELHDRVGTNLTAIKLMVSHVLKAHRAPQTDDIEDQLQVAIHEIKEIIYDLTPPSLERYGLFAGLKNYISKISAGIPLKINLKTFGEETNDYNLNIAMFRVLQELISNSIKHSRATEITIHINFFEDVLSIIFEDNGTGFEHDAARSGLGLDNIDSRVQSLNGKLTFESGEFGICYTIDIPLKKTEKKEAS